MLLNHYIPAHYYVFNLPFIFNFPFPLFLMSFECLYSKIFYPVHLLLSGYPWYYFYLQFKKKILCFLGVCFILTFACELFSLLSPFMVIWKVSGHVVHSLVGLHDTSEALWNFFLFLMNHAFFKLRGGLCWISKSSFSWSTLPCFWRTYSGGTNERINGVNTLLQDGEWRETQVLKAL